VLRKLLVTLAAVLVMGVAAPGIAEAEPPGGTTCRGYACDNQDPYATNCASGAYVKYSAYVSSSNWINLWYSPTCATAWAQTGAVGFSIKVVSYWTSGAHRMTVSSYTQYYVRYTRMVYDGGGLVAEACEGLPFTDGQGWVCTARY